MKSKSKILVLAFLFAVGVAGVFFAGTVWALPYYQLRDVSGERDGHTIAGSQWFAVVTEGREFPPLLWYQYWDTHGGEAPAVPMVTSADLIYDFSSVYLDDPQRNTILGDDISFDPIQAVCLVIKEGQGELKLNFGNNYASHISSTAGPQDAMEDVLLSVSDYQTRVTPSSPRHVASGDSLPVEFFFQAESPQTYGSSPGYLTFRQSTSFDAAFQGFRESIKIPIVVANVYDGAADEPGNELYFDMTVSNGIEVITRKKFRWGVNENMTHDLGNFFMIQPLASPLPQYMLTTRITNRTGTRYRAQRYDTLLGSYGEIAPRSWLYDLTPDLYGSLPASFDLDAQSQIAPGLVTVYNHSMDMAYATNESFRLYPYRGSAPASDLRLTYRKIRGLSPIGAASSTSSAVPPWSLTAFNMTFVDVLPNEENTADEIAAHTDGRPVMPDSFAPVGIVDQYINADSFNAFTISSDVPGSLTTSDDSALLPVRVRLRVSRREAPLVSQWDAIVNADSVVNTFADICALYVRSPNTSELDMNLFTTLRNRGYGVEQCVQAFTDDNYLYLDFIVLLADAVSKNTGKTAFCQVIEDDGVPYILIGDGEVDNRWNLTFYVARAGSSSGLDPNPTDPLPASPADGEGTGCNQGHTIFALALALGALRIFKAKLRK